MRYAAYLMAMPMRFSRLARSQQAVRTLRLTLVYQHSQTGGWCARVQMVSNSSAGSRGSRLQQRGRAVAARRQAAGRDAGRARGQPAPGRGRRRRRPCARVQAQRAAVQLQQRRNVGARLGRQLHAEGAVPRRAQVRQVPQACGAPAAPARSRPRRRQAPAASQTVQSFETQASSTKAVRRAAVRRPCHVHAERAKTPPAARRATPDERPAPRSRAAPMHRSRGVLLGSRRRAAPARGARERAHLTARRR